MKWRLKAGAAVTFASLVVTSVSTSPAWASGPRYYMVATSNLINFVEVAQSAGSVVGKFYLDYETGATPNEYVSTGVYPFSGSDVGGHLTLYFASGPLSSDNPVFGTMNAAKFMFRYTEDNGALGTAVFWASGVGAYNRALGTMTGRVDRANAVAAHSAEVARYHQQLLANLDKAASAVQDDLSALQSPGSLGNDLNYLQQTDLNYLNQTDLNYIQHTDLPYFQNDDVAEGYDPCNDIRSAYGDAHAIYTDGQSMVSDARSWVGSDLRAEQRTLAAAPSTWAAYWAVNHASLRPNVGTPPPLTAVRVLSARVTRGAVSQVNKDIDQANGYIATGYRLINNVDSKYHCGPTVAAAQLAHVTAAWLISG